MENFFDKETIQARIEITKLLKIATDKARLLNAQIDKMRQHYKKSAKKAA